MATQNQDIDNEMKERTPTVKALASPHGVEMVNYYSDEVTKEEKHPLDEFFCWKERKDMPAGWEVLAWYDHPDGNKSYVLGSDGRWYWEYEGAFMLLLDEELEEFNGWRFFGPAVILHLNGEVQDEKEVGLQNACGLETIQEEDEEAEELQEAQEVNDVNTNDRNSLATIWGLDIIIEEVDEAFKGVEEVVEAEDHDDEESVWGLEDFENVNEDDENYKLFL